METGAEIRQKSARHWATAAGPRTFLPTFLFGPDES